MYLRKSILTFGLTIGTLLVAPAQGDAQAGPAPRTGHVPASDGINYYYEIQGRANRCCCCTAGSCRSTCRARCCKSLPRSGR